MESSILWMWLNHTVGISRSKQIKLLHHFKNIESIYEASLSDYAELDFLSQEQIELLCQKNANVHEAECELMDRQNIKVATIDCPTYPEALKTINDPPTVLYMRGRNVDLNNRLCIAMVGTRKATDYGKDNAFNIASDLAKKGIVVVSGLAMGIDTQAHKGSLFVSAPTVAVVGCGVNVAYPKSNSALMEQIASEGLVMSEYPINSAPETYHFPERNRIISGLCRGTLVVEADIKSGSLITAELAYEQQKDVFAIPGNINSIYSKGTNQLLKGGAHFVTCSEDIIEYYRDEYHDKFTPFAPNSKPNEPTMPTIEIGSGSAEDIIASVLTQEPVHIDTICAITRLDTGSVNSALLLMELKGKVKKLSNGFYIKA